MEANPVSKDIHDPVTRARFAAIHIKGLCQVWELCSYIHCCRLGCQEGLGAKIIDVPPVYVGIWGITSAHQRPDRVAHVCRFFASYLVSRGTRYLWNSFSSNLRSTDVGVGQGSALSPVLSALYLAPVIWLFEWQAVHVGCNVLSYIDDSTLIQRKMLEDNLPPLHEAYKIMFSLFDVFGLVMEHNKSKLFHFTCQQDDANPLTVLDFEPFTAASPLKPKTFWRYLGFYFDWTLSFREHIRYYSTKAISTVRTMGMLGNLLQGLTPKQKRILYWACIVPIAMCRFCLWYNDFAKCKGHLQSLTKMQRCAALWIIGAFRTSPTGGCKALAGLIPIHLHLRKLASQAMY
ncbi:hypothetical protein NP233_g4356 [Leucocoprinus birnbaumii]|uniref:Reverse transcriptase domain-containing protein n=1 Tax=Leucocoprinus birnbaumii TaxID=56174 RepID=A0AAD5VUT4_9AGAR|nr:hypothetical protein NP233_g4356 [Leucocoprinus birnbaumii]